MKFVNFLLLIDIVCILAYILFDYKFIYSNHFIGNSPYLLVKNVCNSLICVNVMICVYGNLSLNKYF